MPLTLTDEKVRTEAGENAFAEDTDGTRVVVVATDEAIQDYGWLIVANLASEKYDRKDFVSAGPPPIVRVTTTDCAAWGGDRG